MGSIPAHLYPLKDYADHSKGLLLVDHNNLSLLEQFDLKALKQAYHVLIFHNWWYDRRIDPERHLNYFYHQRDDGQPLRFDTRFKISDAYDLADLICSMSTRVLAKLSCDSGMDWSDKAFLMGPFNFVDGRYWTPTKTPKIYDFVMSATTFNERKNFAHALKVIDRLYRHPRAKGMFSRRIAIGYCRTDPDYFAQTMQFAQSRGLHIDHLIEPSMSDLRELYRQSRVCFHPSYADTAARVINECLCCGVPVIQTDCDWAQENWLLPDNPAVFFDRDGDPDAIYDWLATMSRDFVIDHCIPDIHATHTWLDEMLAARFDDWECGRLIKNPHFGKAKIHNDSEEFAVAIERFMRCRTTIQI